MLCNGTILSSAFDNYTIKKQIGQGGSGIVFLAENTDGEKFAIKVINKNNTNKIKIKRFKNEMNFCSKSEHENIIKIIDVGSYKSSELDCLFYVMPFFSSNLRKEINSGIEPEKIIHIFLQLLSGLNYAHAKGIWHRDIKPENILYDSNKDIAVIADFGIAHFCEDDIITAVETKATDRLANFTYASPEQRSKGIPIDGRADIYALGLILNEMFTKSIISGSNYKKISDVDEKYGFLDKLVDKIICQNSTTRLFPVKKIEIELSALLKAEKDKKELQDLTNRQIFEKEIIDPLFEQVTLQEIKYEDNKLLLYLDKKTNPTWDNILQSGSYSHNGSSLYPTHVFKAHYDDKKKCTVFVVNVPLSRDHLIKSIVEYFKDWLPIVSNMYKTQEEHRRKIELDREIAKREQEIKNKEKEIEINKKLKSFMV